jgi:CubicO group peptidase (beta-lactamase class C family)
MQRTAIVVIAGAFLLIVSCSKSVNSPEPATLLNDWPKSTLSAENIDTTKLNGVLDFIASSEPGICSITMIRNGNLVLDRYYRIWDSDTTYNLYSTTKSVMGALVGIALQDSLIKGGLKAKILDFFPEMTFENLTDAKKNMTIEDFLTLRTGLQWNDDADDFYDDTNPVQFILNKPMDTIPGTAWNYNSGAPHVLSAIITKVAKMSTCQYAKEKLFAPLGITEFDWEVDRKGIFYGGYGLLLKPKDLAKIGQVYLDSGLWRGSRIISSNWIATSIDSHTSTYWPTNGTYGYLWWINSFGGYCTRGAYGQNMYVFSDKNLIIVFTGNLDITTADQTLNNMVAIIWPSIL